MLDRVLSAECERLKEGCRERAFRGPVCALAFIYVEDYVDSPELLATYTYALSEAKRQMVLAEGGEQAADIVWSPPEWDHEHLVDPAEPEAYRAAEPLVAELERARCTDPEGAFLRELAYTLARLDWTGVMDVSDDFACWATEHEYRADVFEIFRATNKPETVRAYERRGWLPPAK